MKDAAICFVCSLFSTLNKKREEAWIVNGVKNWGEMRSCGHKKGKLAAHFSSDGHKESLMIYHNFSLKDYHIDALLDQIRRQSTIEAEKIKLHNNEVIKILVDITRTLARRGLAFRGDLKPNCSGEIEEDGNFMQIVHSLARHNSVMDSWLKNKNYRSYNVIYCISPQSQNELINLIGEEVNNRILLKVDDSPLYQ